MAIKITHTYSTTHAGECTGERVIFSDQTGATVSFKDNSITDLVNMDTIPEWKVELIEKKLNMLIF